MMKKNNPLVSIITPNYNYGHYIDKTIESVLNQNYENIEHIIIDDGSTDNSVEIINKYIESNPDRIKLITQKNQGQTTAINNGLKIATGEIIGWINSDDIYFDNAIQNIVNEFSINDKLNVVFGDLITIDAFGNNIIKIKQLPLDLYAGIFIGFGKLVASNTVFWKKTLMENVGLLNEDFKCNMDGEYFSRLFVNANASHIKKFIAGFRIHPQANSSDFNPLKMKRFKYELEFELRQSYSNLLISKSIPYRLSYLLKIVLRLKRILIRLLSGHYN